MKIIQKTFGEVNNRLINQYTMVNDNGIEVTCINYGCIITKIITPDKEGNFENIVLGYDKINDYITNHYYFGAIVGRVAGRIKGAAFELDGETYELAKNENSNHLHGGMTGFDKVIWDAAVIENDQEIAVKFSYHSPDGEEGYPGNLDISVTYSLNQENELSIQYTGHTDKKTLLNMTSHSYFNLSGNFKRDVLNHALKIKSKKYLELNEENIPTGDLLDVTGTPFDFTSERMIKTGVESEHPHNILVGKGYDHPFLLQTNHDNEIILMEKESGRTLTVETDEVGVVVYSGNFIENGGYIQGVPSRKYLGICLETQGLPDSIHHPHFPSWVLEKGKEYSSVTKYKFGIMNTNTNQI